MDRRGQRRQHLDRHQPDRQARHHRAERAGRLRSPASSNAYYPGSGSTVFFQGGGTGGFTVTASGSSDAQSGLAGYTYPALGSGWTNIGGAYSFDGSAGTQTGSVTAQNNAGLSSAGTSFTAQSDSTAPTGSVTCNTVACSAGWYTSSPVAVAITGADSSGAGVERIVYTTDGSTPTINGSDVVTHGTEVDATSASFNVTSDGTTTITWIAEDNVGNVSSPDTQIVKLDTSAPTAPTGFTFSGTTEAYYPGSGSTVYFQGGGSGGFTIAASGSTDSDSGVAGYTYPALGSGWTHTNGDYTFDNTAGTQSGNVTAQNNAGLSSTGTSFTAQTDATAPTSSISCNSTACIAGWYTSRPVSIAIAGSDAAAGVQRITYTTDGSDPTSSGTATTVTRRQRQLQHHHPRHHHRQVDHRGQRRQHLAPSPPRPSSSTPAHPTAPTLGFSGLSNAYYPGSGSTVYVESGATGGFTVTGSGSTDGESGVAGYTYPTLGGGFSNTAGAYTFNSATTQSGSVTAQNNAGLSSTGTGFTARVDGSAPTSSITCNSNPCGAGWTTSVPVNIDITGNDGTGSGVKQIVYTTDGSDPTTSGTATTVNASTASFQLSTPQTIKWFAVDDLGNASTRAVDHAPDRRLRADCADRLHVHEPDACVLARHWHDGVLPGRRLRRLHRQRHRLDRS